MKTIYLVLHIRRKLVRYYVKCDVSGQKMREPNKSNQFKTNTRTLAFSVLLVIVGVSFMSCGLLCGRFMSIHAFMR